MNSSSSSGVNGSHGPGEPTTAALVTGIEISSLWTVDEILPAAETLLLVSCKVVDPDSVGISKLRHISVVLTPAAKDWFCGVHIVCQSRILQSCCKIWPEVLRLCHGSGQHLPN
jgi:hypothetical protein